MIYVNIFFNQKGKGGERRLTEEEILTQGQFLGDQIKKGCLGMERTLYSVSKELALQALGPEFSLQNSRKNVKCGAIHLEAQCWGSGHKRSLGPCWSASVA